MQCLCVSMQNILLISVSCQQKEANISEKFCSGHSILWLLKHSSSVALSVACGSKFPRGMQHWGSPGDVVWLSFD